MTAINDLITEIQDLQSKASALATYISGLESSNSTLTTQVSSLQAQLDAANKKIAQLQAIINGPTPPPPGPPPVSSTQFGIDVSTLSETDSLQTVIAKHRATWGAALPHIRVFSGGTISQWTDPIPKVLVPGDKPVFSFKQWDLASFNSFMDGIPAGFNEVWVCHYHEPEDDAKKSGDVANFIKNYLNVYAQLDAARKAHKNGPKVKLVKIFMYYQEVTAKQVGCTWNEFHGGQSFVDALGFDCYNPANWANQQNRYATPDELFGELLAAHKATGIPFCVPELGSILAANDTNGKNRAAAIAGWVKYLQDNGCLWANWWCSNGNVGSGFDYRLENDTYAKPIWLSAMNH